MIIKSLTLNNFRVFRGVHEIDLSPKTQSNEDGESSPIILLGGLNGAGKTSILLAVRFALYGKNAFDSSLSTEDYKKQLSSLIHNNENEPSSSSIELCFEYNHHGETREYTVTRSWKKGQLDKVQLRQADTLKSELTDNQCQGFLNELIPLGVADLFFFDGEKIAELAEDNSGTILRTAVQRLLGLDVIGRLQSDLAILLKRSNSKVMPKNIKSQIKALEKEQRSFENAAEVLEQEITDARTSIISLKAELNQIEQALFQSGGAWAEDRHSEQAKIDNLIAEKAELEKSIRQELESTFPISLAPETSSQLINLLEHESEIKQRKAFKKELTQFLDKADELLAQKLPDNSAAMETLNNIAHSYRHEGESDELGHDISDRELANLKLLAERDCKQSQNKVSNAVKRLAYVEQTLEQASVNIARAPEQDQIKEQLNLIKALNEKLTQTLLFRKGLIHNAQKEYKNAADTARKIQKLHNAYRADTNTEESITNAKNAKNLLSDFALNLKLARIEHIQSAFNESYKKFARKGDSALSARIDPDTFNVDLVDEKERIINRRNLSAGEKQIYAIAILEALAKASGHKLPIIIDTPLGRLDSKHREKLIKYYFPYASHQVIILSTDTEVDRQYFNWINDKVSSSYEVEFDQATMSSHFKSGYFWKSNFMEVR